MGSCDHVDVIRTVTYCQCPDMWLVFTNEVDNLGFLLRRDSTRDDYLASVSQLKEDGQYVVIP
jgi:hypothetical protein